MMMGTMTERELGGPMMRRPLGPSQPSAPTIQMMAMKSPVSVSSRSERVRMKSRTSMAMSRSARPIRGAMPSSVALLYSSSKTVGEMLLT